MPAPKGNRSAMKHGVYGFLALGTLPKGASYIRKLLGKFRQHLEADVLDKTGEVSVFNAALIQSACRHEGRALLLTRWLREADESDDGLKLSDKLAVLREIGNATDARDRALKQLGLDRADAGNLVDALYGTPNGHDNGRLAG